MKRISVMTVLLLLPAATALAQEPPEALPAPPPGAVPAPPVGVPAPGALPMQPPVAGQPGQPYIYPLGRRPPRRSTRVRQPMVVYGELLGKGFIYGIGADYNLTKWLGLGGVFSYYSIADFRAGLVAPYVALYAGGVRNAFVTQVGPELRFASDGDWWIWEGGDDADAAGQVSLGYEYRNGFVFRAMMTFFFNNNGVAVWPGLTFGGAF